MSLTEFKGAVKAGQYQTARWLFVKLLDDPGLSREDLAEAYCEASVAEHKAGNLHTAIAWCKVAAGLATETNQVMLLSRISLNLMGFQRLSGDTGAAAETGLRWLEEFGEHPALAFRKGRYFYNLALVYRQRAEGEKALEYYELAWNHLGRVRQNHADPAERSQCLTHEVMALHNAAWLMYEMGLGSLADDVVERARDLVPKENAYLAREHMLLDAYKAHFNQEPEAVLEIVDQIFGPAQSIPANQLFWSYWLAASAHHRLGRTGMATAYATMATQEAERTKDVRLIRMGHTLEQETTSLTS